jgi:SSS family solute:Na+ symporter
MNWSSHEFIWLDWVILAVGICAVAWAVWRSVQKDKRYKRAPTARTTCLVKESPGISLVRLSLLQTLARNTL